MWLMINKLGSHHYVTLILTKQPCMIPSHSLDLEPLDNTVRNYIICEQLAAGDALRFVADADYSLKEITLRGSC
jgi:hypothetical protein